MCLTNNPRNWPLNLTNLANILKYFAWIANKLIIIFKMLVNKCSKAFIS